MKRSLAFGCRAVLLVSLVASPALAGDQKPAPNRPRPPRPSLESMEAAKAKQLAIFQQLSAHGPDQFGTNCCQILQIPASSFVPVDGSTYRNDDLYGYTYVTAFGNTNDDLMATLTLPSGSHIQFIDLYFNDTNVIFDLDVTVYQLTGGNLSGGSGAAGHNLVGEVTSFGSSGQNYSTTEVDYTVNNNAAYDLAGGQYTVYVAFPVSDGSISFKGVDIWWNRQVSPAPATATFNDVPTADGAFQWIEAFNRASITAGCQVSPPLFCPDGTVTRRQMAVFFAKALGLYWPL